MGRARRPPLSTSPDSGACPSGRRSATVATVPGNDEVPFALPFGAITDVPGLRVGHHHRTGRGWQTGTTVVVVPGGATPGVDVRGGGPGTRETDALAPQNLVRTIHAVCLTGGSAYGLAAADGVAQHLEGLHLGFPVGPEPEHVVPVVPAAVIFDLGRGGRFDRRPDATFGERAARTATTAQRRWGSVGAGTGARAGGLQGGVGTAGTTIPVRVGPDETADVHVGAIAVVNANGSPVDPLSGLPWHPGDAPLRRPVAAERRALRAALARPTESLNTTIGVVATSADLGKSEVSRLASVAHDGLARAVRPAHSVVDGDTIFGLATGDQGLADPAPAFDRDGPLVGSRIAAVDAILRAAADTFAAACTHALLAATRLGDAPTYLELCPSARR